LLTINLINFVATILQQLLSSIATIDAGVAEESAALAAADNFFSPVNLSDAHCWPWGQLQLDPPAADSSTVGFRLFLNAKMGQTAAEPNSCYGVVH